LRDASLRGAQRGPRRRRGAALLAVLVFLTVGLAMVAVQQRHIATALSAEQASRIADNFREGAAVAMAEAVTVLETGDPPASPFTCQTDVSTSQGAATFAVTYTAAGANQWTVSVAPADGSLLPELPGSF
jgi:hypothetical protein